MTDEIEIGEMYLIMLLAVEDRPLPSRFHIQKELFVLSQINPKIQEIFNFKKHYKGPYSQFLDEIIDAPMYHPNSFITLNQKILITSEGQKNFLEIKNKFSQDKKFIELISTLKLIRELYDKLSINELLFLIYETYPEYTKFSDISDRLLKNKSIRKIILDSLSSKGVITDKRYLELKEK